MCLVIYTFVSFLVFYLIDGVLTLPGIAAMLLGIGMAIDANIISFDNVQFSNADVNGDGKVTSIDARWILQLAAGMRTL